MATERDYVLGTHDEEISRLGLQHRVWRPVALDCWQRAGITVGSRVLDLGAGPGYAAVDLAEIVGPMGKIVALERSSNFVRALQERCRARDLGNVQIHELDLMTDSLPEGPYDFSWCRWVASFVTDPALLVQKLGRVMRTGSVAIFHEYAHYLTWRFVPDCRIRNASHKRSKRVGRPRVEKPISVWTCQFISRRMALFYGRPCPGSIASDRATTCGNGPGPLSRSDWPGYKSWVASMPLSPIESGRKWPRPGANPNALMITPLVLEIVAEKVL